MVRRKNILEMKVVFDTNALYTKAESELLSAAVNTLIEENSSHPDLKVSWYLPEVVRHEREYQMRRRAFDLLPNIEKLERLLGHNLNITPEILEARVDDAINRSLQEHNIEVLELAADNVEWKKLILDSSFRRPPFESGQSEKGFRDAIIVEVFLQLVEQSPTTPTICRLVLVSNDDLLFDAASARTDTNNNVKIVRSIEEVEGLINTLVSDVKESFIENIKEQSRFLFFVENNEDTLYYKEKIQSRIIHDFSNELFETPEAGQYRENGMWYVIPPNFFKKEGQRVYWLTSISVKAEIYRDLLLNDPFPSAESSGGLGLTGVFSPSGTGSSSLGLSSSQTPSTAVSTLRDITEHPTRKGLLSASRYEKRKERNGRSFFEVLWSVQVSQNGRISKARIEKIEFIETVWD